MTPELSLCQHEIALPPANDPLGVGYCPMCLRAEVERLREALIWAVGFIRCQKPQAEADYPDMRNAISLVEKSSLYSGEFHQLGIRAELAEEKARRLQSKAESHEDQLVRIANYLGKDARHAKDGTIAGLVIEELNRLQAEVSRLTPADY